MLEKSETEWKSILSSDEYEVTRKGGTEPAFSGEYNDHKGKGVYKCACCEKELFGSEEKFSSGSGWPSFWQPINEKNVREQTDSTFGMKRTEVICDNCGAHLGHVFEDGPEPTGLRYCINSLSLGFESAE